MRQISNITTISAPIVSAPASSVPTTTSSKKQTQRWINFGIVYDFDNLNASDAGFCAAGYGTPADDVEGLRKKLVRGTKRSRAAYQGIINIHEHYLNLLTEGGQSEYQLIGSIVPESQRKGALEHLLDEAGISAELKKEILETAFPTGGAQWAIQYHRQGVKQVEEEALNIPLNRL